MVRFLQKSPSKREISETFTVHRFVSQLCPQPMAPKFVGGGSQRPWTASWDSLPGRNSSRVPKEMSKGKRKSFGLMVISWWFSWDKLGKPTSVWGYSARCCPSFASWLGWQRYISPFFLGFITPRVKMSMPSGNHLPEKTCKGCVFGYFLYLSSSFKWYLWGANMIFPEKWSTPKSMVYKLIFPTIIVILRINPPFSGATSDSHWCLYIHNKRPENPVWNHHISGGNHTWNPMKIPMKSPFFSAKSSKVCPTPGSAPRSPPDHFWAMHP